MAGMAITIVIPEGEEAARAALFDLLAAHPGVHIARQAPVHPGKGRQPTLPSPLTARETEILVLIARGLTNAQIAGELNVSPGTVRNHVTTILAKLGAANRTQAAAWAVRARLRTAQNAETKGAAC
jgi:DNA-binding CsgD family transcriptional regulator